MGNPSKGIGHVVSIETFGPKRRTILATTPQGVTLGTPLPNGGWCYAIVTPEGRTAVAESEYRGEATVQCCEQLGLDPVRQLGRAGVERVMQRRRGAG